MIDDETVRELALSLPEAKEQDHRGHPSFRVRGKIFATLWPGKHRAVLKLPLDEQAALVGSEPMAFSLNAWSRQGWTEVNLRQVSAAQFERLLDMAWRGVAPKKLARSEAPKTKG